MERVQNVNLIDMLKEVKSYLVLTGFYPMKKTKYIFLQYISATIVFFFGVTYIGFAIKYSYDNVYDLREFSESCAFVLTQVALVFKLTNLLFNKKTILQVEEMLQNPIFTTLNAEETNILNDSMKTFQRIKKFSAVKCAADILVASISSLVNKKLFLKMWLPIDMTNYFAMGYLYQEILFCLGISFVFAIDIFAIFCLDLCATQFVLLRHRLENIGLHCSKDRTVDDDTQMIQQLKKCAVHHSYINRLAQLIEAIFSVGIFAQFVCCNIILCFSMLGLVITPVGSYVFAIWVSYGSNMLWQLFIYCYFGQRVVDMSDTISEACYMSKWYDCSLKVRQYLITVMTAANEPVIIKAGKLFPLTLVTLKTILSTTYSFFTLVWQMYNEK